MPGVVVPGGRVDTDDGQYQNQDDGNDSGNDLPGVVAPRRRRVPRHRPGERLRRWRTALEASQGHRAARIAGRRHWDAGLARDRTGRAGMHDRWGWCWGR
ncbi:hypothetical protein [Mycobacterium asiaticum]|uniref:hypothetical protein n=1 Tax=Mycobacterium asiaticum TaxID=1790 RepID=UPI001C12C8FD|nr:hypothetical protein [Mycobacterium asiaticum]